MELKTPSAPRKSTATILLVDDDPLIRTLTRTFLERNGYGVLTCGDAVCADDVVQHAMHIDLLVTDLHMPHFSGIELGRRFKQLRPGIPILLISGSLLNGMQVEQLRHDGWNFLDKPFTLPALLASVGTLLANPAKPELQTACSLADAD